MADDLLNLNRQPFTLIRHSVEAESQESIEVTDSGLRQNDVLSSMRLLGPFAKFYLQRKNYRSKTSALIMH